MKHSQVLSVSARLARNRPGLLGLIVGLPWPPGVEVVVSMARTIGMKADIVIDYAIYKP